MEDYTEEQPAVVDGQVAGAVGGESAFGYASDEDLGLPADGPRYFMLTDVEVAEYSAARETRLLEALAAVAARYPDAPVSELIDFAKTELVSRDLESDQQAITNPTHLLALEAGSDKLNSVLDEQVDVWEQGDADDELILDTAAIHEAHEQEGSYVEDGVELEVQSDVPGLLDEVTDSYEDDLDEEPIFEQPVIEEPVVEEPVQEELVVEEPTVEEPEAFDEVTQEELIHEDEDNSFDEEEPYTGLLSEVAVIPEETDGYEDDAYEETSNEESWVPEAPISRIDGHQLTAEELLEEDTLTDAGIPFPASNEYESYEVVETPSYNVPARPPVEEPAANEPTTATGSYDPFADLDDDLTAAPAPATKRQYHGLFQEAGLIDKPEEHNG